MSEASWPEVSWVRRRMSLCARLFPRAEGEIWLGQFQHDLAEATPAERAALLRPPLLGAGSQLKEAWTAVLLGRPARQPDPQAPRPTAPLADLDADSAVEQVHPWSGLNCSILSVDIRAFGAHGRNNLDRLDLRINMYKVLQAAFTRAGVNWRGCHYEDRGDGALIVVPPDVPTSELASTVRGLIADGLRQHNQEALPQRRLQLRASLNAGPVTRDTFGVCGDSITHAFRLLEAPMLKEHLARSGADLGFIASTFVYKTAIRLRPGTVSPADYREVSMRGAELTAWIYVSA